MSATLQFDKAMLLFSDFSKRYLNKIVVDATNNKKPIGTDVENMYWLQAFENVLRANKMWYDEREEFLYVYSPADSQRAAPGGVVAGPGGRVIPIDSTGRVLFNQRDLRISSVFFTVDIVKSLNAGIDWSFFYRGDTTQAGARPTQYFSSLSSGVTSAAESNAPGFFTGIAPAISFSNVSALIQFFQNNQLGDVLSGPSITVSSGKQGRIQVGQDFYVTTRDFAGNPIQSVQSAGIIIVVKPTLYEENGVKFINMDVDAERSTLTGGASDRIVNRSKATTFSVLYDGEETVIGGLYSTTEGTTRGGIPILKDLPWWVFGLRYLFGFDQTLSSTQELIILLKAEVIPTIEERIANAAKKDANLIEQQRQQHARDIEKYKKKKD
jgi:type IV pilus assembly protein PilQ